MEETWLYFCRKAVETAACLRAAGSGFTSREGLIFREECLSFASSGSQTVPQNSARPPAGTVGFSAKCSGTTRGKHRSTSALPDEAPKAGERAGGGNRRAGGVGQPREAFVPHLTTGERQRGCRTERRREWTRGSHDKIEGEGGKKEKEEKKEKTMTKKKKIKNKILNKPMSSWEGC